jgi:starvation-inducible outer membrane lipoprotein
MQYFKPLTNGLVFTTLALMLAACASTPTVMKTTEVDNKGRKVSVLHICKSAINIEDPLGPKKVTCHEERTVHNFCYRTIGDVACYEEAQPGRLNPLQLD